MTRLRWGKLQEAALFCLIDHPEAKTAQIAGYLAGSHDHSNICRAFRTIARRVRRERWQWVWRLKDGIRLSKE
jgi:hypothetical protein